MLNKIMKDKKILIVLILMCIIIAIIVYFIKYFNSPVKKFKDNIDKEDISYLSSSYDLIENYEDKKKAKKSFEDYLDSIIDKYINNEQDYDKTLEDINRYESLEELKTSIEFAKNKLEEIKVSKKNFNEAQNYEKENNSLEALWKYSQVIEKDAENYKIAKNYIKDNKNKVKTDILIEVDDLISKNDYATANQKLNKLSEVIEGDNEIKNRINSISDKAREQEIENLKNKQEVSVESSKKHKEWYSDTTSGVQTIVKNNTNKVVKNYTLGILAYDSNGYPLQIEYNSFLKLCKADASNIQPGETHGSDKYCDIYYEREKIDKAIACVKEVEYYDGSIWENPYYEYWIEKYEGNPIEE